MSDRTLSWLAKFFAVTIILTEIVVVVVLVFADEPAKVPAPERFTIEAKQTLGQSATVFVVRDKQTGEAYVVNTNGGVVAMSGDQR